MQSLMMHSEAAFKKLPDSSIYSVAPNKAGATAAIKNIAVSPSHLHDETGGLIGLAK